MRRGDRGEAVRVLQQQLKDNGYNIAVDGIYGPQTEAAVLQFQQDAKAAGSYPGKIDGIWGPQTARAMEGRYPKPAPPPPFQGPPIYQPPPAPQTPGGVPPLPGAPNQTPVPATPSPATPVLTIEQRARLAFPWMPEPIVQRFIDSWVELGDPELALARVRQDPLYQQFFPGNRRADGSLRLSEADYYSTVLGYRDVFKDYGINPDEFEARGLFAKAIEGELSVNEVARRARGIWAGIEGDLDQIRDFYATNYGLTDITPQAIFASAIDSTIGEDILSRRITSAQIGGVAAAFGFSRSREEAERLAGLGVDRAQAQQLYTQARERLGGLQTFAERFGDLDPTVDIGEFERAAVEGDVEQRRRFARLTASELASFTGYDGITRDRTGALVGLRAR
jgi:Putative peptidoglycan binding domain